MNRRFNMVLSDFSDTVEIYSIDESFFRLPILPSGLGDVEQAQRIRATIKPKLNSAGGTHGEHEIVSI